MDTLTEVMPGPVNPDGPATPDAIKAINHVGQPHLSVPYLIITVGVVSEEQLKVTPVGNWSTYTSETYKKKEFAKDSKYNFLIISPKNDPVFAANFPVYIAALKKQQNSVSKTGIDKWLLAKDGSDDAIRFSFKVFKPKTATNSDTDINIKMWPVPTECRDELAKIAGSHVIRPFMVYDTDGSIVEPLDIPSKLLGALVECSFGIIHYHFGTDDSFSECKASEEPEGSSSKHVNTSEAEIVSKDGDNDKDAETVENELEKDAHDKGKTHA
ncbi:hypothetical protein DFH08DRAFT_823608 [Mycena albidolilacea]|uniref:Uncharacterized protein n=1 Tax=Mycena albidolilacea TaxID=1033008 RepID=A0AAD6Z6V9_9AGAR|nr:hypothetical protein DFH08DRAFT_823608 [Mycena albidolilacea]